MSTRNPAGSAGTNRPGRAESAAQVSQREASSAEPSRTNTDHGAARPPGRVLSGGHGPQEPVLAQTAVDKLRKVLDLSPASDIDQVCTDAADTIGKLRESATKQSCLT